MEWIKKGLLYCPDGKSEWMNNSVLTPQPFLLNEDVIRIYCSFRDSEGRGRIGYLDLEAKDPGHIIKVSDKPVLDLGKAGCFDDNGMILGDVLRVKDKLYMYYVAFQKVQRVKFLAFSGLAISDDNGEHFKRIGNCPIMDRTDEGIYGRCIHSVIYDGCVFKIWYSVIFDWTYINGIPYPTYDIKYIESEDGMTVDREGVRCVACRGDEYRIGRSKVRVADGKYEMLYTYDTLRKEYRVGYAESMDGKDWVRKDEFSWLKPSPTGWDSEMVCYPVIIDTKYGTYMFYDGNGMGLSGFGYAQLIK